MAKTIQERLRTAHIGLAVDGTLMREAADEIDRLAKCLKKANDKIEHFEREWYLRGDRIEELESLLRKCYKAASMPGNHRGACYCIRQWCQDAKINLEASDD